MSTNKINLPSDLQLCEEEILFSLLSALKDANNNRFSIFLGFQGLKLMPITFRLYKSLFNSNYSPIVIFSDSGNTALAKRDYPELSSIIYSYKELSDNISTINYNLVISVSPQPYEYDDYEKLINSIHVPSIMINGKLEETAIGVGYVGRERRINFIKSWYKLYWLEPFNTGALYKKYDNDWLLYSYSRDGFRFKESFTSRPDKESITIALSD
ncbi:DUF1995 family protein [Prochlorococcus marinus]|uniref:DUF1995 family protein n=1 Tax=Prochlorococcus marinus TaxID=1219 RepID=UPI0022B46497|nr:DUF1995 family protein [Prochlorococcus marinus]